MTEKNPTEDIEEVAAEAEVLLAQKEELVTGQRARADQRARVGRRAGVGRRARAGQEAEAEANLRAKV